MAGRKVRDLKGGGNWRPRTRARVPIKVDPDDDECFIPAIKDPQRPASDRRRRLGAAAPPSATAGAAAAGPCTAATNLNDDFLTQEISHDDDLGFIDPTVGGGKARILLAPRPMDLAGKVVGLLDNTKEQGDLILETIADALRERYGVRASSSRRKEHYSKPATDELIDEMAKEVEVAIAAVGG